MTPFFSGLTRSLIPFVLASTCLVVSCLGADVKYDYRVLATSKTSTMEKEINQAAAEGYEFQAVMGGETAIGGKEVVIVMGKLLNGPSAKKRYALLATSKTATMQKELEQAGDEGFDYKGQTVFESVMGGREVSVILERDAEKPSRRIEFLLVATSKTATLQKELQGAGDSGFRLVGLTIGRTAFGGAETLGILRRDRK